MHNTNLHTCECEHAAHFDENDRTPCGNNGHRYGETYTVLVTLRVPGAGTFHVCPACARDCHGGR